MCSQAPFLAANGSSSTPVQECGAQYTMQRSSFVANAHLRAHVELLVAKAGRAGRDEREKQAPHNISA